MDKIADVIYLISNTSGYNDKLYLLKKNQKLPGLKEALKFIYNPFVRTGISKLKLEKALNMRTTFLSTEPITLQEVIEYFSKHTTGSDADLAFAAYFIYQFENDDLTMEFAKALIMQDLKIGISATSLNTAYGSNFIPKIGCMLGTPYEDVRTVSWPCIVTEKLDGIRRILVKDGDTVRCYSRSGHEDTGLVEIIKEAEWLPSNMVFDGELLAKGTFKDSIALRQATSSIANSKGAKTGLTYNIFDMIPLEEFYSGKSSQDALTRKTLLASFLRDDTMAVLDERWASLMDAFGIYEDFQHIKSVPILGLAHNPFEVEEIVADIWKAGGEGVMLNTASGLYEIKRSKQLLKVKHTEEHTLQVVNVLEGEGKFEEMLGALVVDYKGSKLGVGSGFTDALRKEIWTNKEAYIGKFVEVETFGESKNALGDVSLNCPIFKRFVGEES